MQTYESKQDIVDFHKAPYMGNDISPIIQAENRSSEKACDTSTEVSLHPLNGWIGNGRGWGLDELPRALRDVGIASHVGAYAH